MTETVLSKGGRRDVYQAVTEKIVRAIEQGAGDFKLPWHRSSASIGRPTNAATAMPYQGVNTVALWAEASIRNFDSGFWATYKQWQSEGAQVRKGETGSLYQATSGTDPLATRKTDPLGLMAMAQSAGRRARSEALPTELA